MPILYDEVTRHKKPDWLKIKLHNNEGYSQVAQILRDSHRKTSASRSQRA